MANSVDTEQMPENLMCYVASELGPAPIAT